jgi:large subunit ribosomal protein L17
MLSNMACSLFMEGRVETSVAKAKELRRLVARMVTLAKRGTLHARRRAISILRQPAVVRKLFAEIGPLFAERQGGYTRIMRLARRRGDAAEMCIIELVTEPVTPKAKQTSEGTEAAAEAATEAEAPDEEGAQGETAGGDEDDSAAETTPEEAK